MNDNAMAAVAEVLVDKLHTTEDDELQAGLFQILDYTARLERRAELAAELLAG